MTMTRERFSDRCMHIFKFLERLKAGPLRDLLCQLGFSKEDLKVLGDVGALRYLGTLCQLAVIAIEHGLHLVTDFAAIKARWDKDVRLPSLAPIFAVQKLRISYGHHAGEAGAAEFAAGARALRINPAEMAGGWGLAMDAVYDQVIRSMDDITALLREFVA